MKALLVALAALACGCAQQPAPAPPTPVPPSASAIYWTIVDGGCLAQTDGGIAAVAQEMQLANPPQWFVCLEEGGSVASCGGCP